MLITHLNPDQAREYLNTSQRFEAYQAAQKRLAGYAGSMFWKNQNGKRYLVRSQRDRQTGRAVQKSLGAWSVELEKLKAEFDRGRTEAAEAFDAISESMTRQAAVNRALRIGRLPELSGKIISRLQSESSLYKGIRIIGTNTLYAIEAAAQVFFSPDIMVTEDIDLLFDSRQNLKILAQTVEKTRFLDELRSLDRSFIRERSSYRAHNKDGFMVDVVTAETKPPWQEVAPASPDDLTPSPITGLAWLQNAPPFKAMVISQNGWPVNMTVPDPRIFVLHKAWLSEQSNRDPLKKKRDLVQAKAVKDLLSERLQHLSFDENILKVLPNRVSEKAMSILSASD